MADLLTLDIDEMEAGVEMDVFVMRALFADAALEDGFGNVWPEFFEDEIGGSGIVGVKRNQIVRPGKVQAEPWSPSTDIAAAWEVVEKMQANGHDWLTLSYASHRIEGLEWMATFRQYLAWDIAKTAPLAICRAALKAVQHRMKEASDA